MIGGMKLKLTMSVLFAIRAWRRDRGKAALLLLLPASTAVTGFIE